ncbi:MAG: Bax inhibitor-1 family protein [Lachnospiraceae bacterium]|nr:Bax inhibitor-1 family protein [Lachnospiraceae bacterium]
MAGLTDSRKEKRLLQYVSEGELIEQRAYNAVMCGVVVYGLLFNYLLCKFVHVDFEVVNPVIFLIGYFVLCVAGTIMSTKSQNPIISFCGYNLVVVPVGLVLSISVQAYGGVDADIVEKAFLLTLLITAGMTAFSILKPELFKSMGKVLFIALLCLMLVGFISYFFIGLYTIYLYLGVALFSLYIGYDIYKSQQYAPTVDNAIDSALDIYLDIVNLFIRILQILARSSSRD